MRSGVDHMCATPLPPSPHPFSPSPSHILCLTCRLVRMLPMFAVSFYIIFLSSFLVFLPVCETNEISNKQMVALTAHFVAFYPRRLLSRMRFNVKNRSKKKD